MRNIQQYLSNVYEVLRSTEARLVAGRKERRLLKAQRHGLPRSSRRVTAVGPEILQRDGAIVREDRRITTRQMALSLPISKGSVRHIILGLGRSTMCARRVPRSVIVVKINFFRVGTF